jgi:ubiquinone/menaquinone biosynthesis C-methylase UbiE
MFNQFRKRSKELEHLDKGDYTPEEYEGCIVELQAVNKWLGDASALRSSLLFDVERAHLQTFSVVDVGAGSGELLRVVAGWSQKTSRSSELVGVELNKRSARAILEQSSDLPSISSVQANAFHLPFANNQFDYAICSLFTHHFNNEQVIEVLRELSRVASRGIYVIDLHRHPIPYYFFRTLVPLFLHNRLIREDGALSILRSFKPQELLHLALQAGLDRVEVTRRFPYRLVLRAQENKSKTAALDFKLRRQTDENFKLAS